MKQRPALIVVDVQRDFCPGGALPVRDGDGVVEPINRLVSLFERRRLPVFFIRDWHPADHISFASRGGPWPPHCVKGTPGAEFYPTLSVPKEATIISKATRRNTEAYSGFQGTDLSQRLRDLGVERLYITGLATDYCVKNTVLDAIAEGFKVDVIEDCVNGVNVKRTDSANAFRVMLGKGARKTMSWDVPKSLN